MENKPSQTTTGLFLRSQELKLEAEKRMEALRKSLNLSRASIRRSRRLTKSSKFSAKKA